MFKVFLFASLIFLVSSNYTFAKKNTASSNKTESVDGIDFTPDEDSSSTSPKLKDIERTEAFDDAIDKIKKAKVAIETMSKNFHTQCLKAFGNDVFCSCVTENRPSGVDFVRYIAFTITPKEDGGYNQLTKDARALIDKTIQARDKCVK
ncbi:hypothetical protein ACLWBD_00470 [Bdellovibrio sp. HCB117]|uniref:hypothetical protein n=1 Tax=Bdellovibrio sp. HCB117 TaxID=3394359 RepID=UPI0039B5DE36